MQLYSWYVHAKVYCCELYVGLFVHDDLHGKYHLADITTKQQQQQQQLKALRFLYTFKESDERALLSSFCDDSNFHISVLKYVVSTIRVSKESISIFSIGNRFQLELHILSPYSNIVQINYTFK